MFESPEFELNLENNEEELYSNINESINFNVIIQNISHRFIPEVTLELLTPPQVKNLTPRHRPSGLSSGKQRKFSFKIKPSNNGLFVMTGLIKEKYLQRAKIPIIIRVGKESLDLELPSIKYEKPKSPYRPPGGVMQPDQFEEMKEPHDDKKLSEYKQNTFLNCPFCNSRINSNSLFCSSCGADLAKEKVDNREHDLKNYCPECGIKLMEGAKFCDQCGKNIN